MYDHKLVQQHIVSVLHQYNLCATCSALSLANFTTLLDTATSSSYYRGNSSIRNIFPVLCDFLVRQGGVMPNFSLLKVVGPTFHCM